MAERARAELAGAVHPADDAAGCEILGDALDQRCFVDLLDELTVLARDARELLRVDRRPPERMIRDVAIRIAEIDAVGIERRAERAAGVAGRRRDEHALESGLGQDPRIRDTVERDAAAEAEVGQPGLAPEARRDVDEDVLEHALDAGGAIGEALPLGGLEIDRLVRMARRAEEVDEFGRIGALGRRLKLEIFGIERERAVGVRRITLRTWSTIVGRP